MKKIIIICLLSLATSLFGQWTLQNPLMNVNDLNDVQFIDQNVGWAVGDNGTVLSTTNGGLNWINIESETFKDLLSLDFINENEGWIQGRGIILHTVDGGESWQKQVECSASGLSSICFTDANNGWAEGIYKGFATWGSYGVHFEVIMRTSDGGQTWQPVDHVHDNIVSLCFTDPNHGWVASNWFYYDDIGSMSGGDISFTMDGGITLTEQNAGSVINSLFFLDTLNGWAVGSELVFTTDGGLNWTTVEDIEGSDVFFADPDNGWIVGKDGLIMQSSDGGENWSDQNSGVSTYLNDVWFSNTETGWAVGENGIILKTVDGGENWSPCFEPTFYDNLYSVSAFDEMNCLAAGNNGQQSVIAGTNNGGEVWEPEYFSEFKIKDMMFTDNSTGWAVGYDSLYKGLIMHTSDGGHSWVEKINDSRPINTIFFINSEKGWAARKNGLIWKTEDGGDTWNYFYSGINSTINSIFFIDENSGWMVGSGAAIASTVDGGNTWQDHSLDFYHDLFDVWFTDANNGWIVGEFGVLHTTDGGTTWEVKYKGQVLDAIYFVDSINGWMAGNDGVIIKTTDGGINWEFQNSSTNKHLYDIAFADLSNGWAVGADGTILYTDNGGTVWTPEPPQQNSEIQLLCFPNPFYGQTTVEFNLQQTSTVEIALYNQIGQQIQIIDRGNYQKGDHQLVFNGSSVPMGIYYCVLKTENGTQTVKMIKINN